MGTSPDGTFAAPVQVSFLLDRGRLWANSPIHYALSLKQNAGEDYIGTFENTFFYLGDVPSQLQGYYMTIMK